MRTDKINKQNILKLSQEISRLKLKVQKYKLALRRKEKRDRELDS